MKKRFLSLLCVLALCMGLLPVTALAAGEIELYVGGQKITESGCYENQNGTWTKVDGTEPANGQFSYDAATATLTLNQAKIVNYQDVTVGGGFTYPGSVIAFSQSADVSLTIEVSQGTSNITGTGGIRVVSKAGDASLSISGPGSLEVKNVSNDSGIVLIGSKNVNLGINSADVTISNVQYYGVQLAAGDECKSTATINDGNLTASGSTVGIYFMRLYNDGPSSLTVSGNAMVDTEGSTGGIINGSSDSFQIGADGESGGIVFNGNSGTVYGNVTLQEDLEIGTDETLTIGKDASLTVPENVKLTNNGKIDNSGELNGTVDGSGTVTPKITTDSLPDGTVIQLYTATLQATGNGITWSLDSGSTLPSGLKLENDTISGTPTAADTSTFTVTATNASGSDSKELTVTINPAPILVSSVTLNKSELSLYTGESETLTATVTPNDATNPNVTWSSDKPEVATVENGEVTAKAAGTATITATAADGSGKSANCKVTVTQSEYSISADTTAIDFGSAYTGYTQPAAQTVTITNTGNQSLTLNQPASTSNFEVGTLTKTVLAAGEAATFTVQPEAGLAVGTYSDDITVSGTNNVNATISATFTVRQYSSGGGTPTKTPSQQAVDKIESAKDGSTVEIKLSTGSTKLDKEVFEELAGRDVTLEISLPGGVSWTVNGQDIPENTDLTDLDLGVSMNTSTIPVSLINSVTGEVGTVQFTLKHNGEFGFTMTLTAPVGVKNAGLWANLYHFDEDAGKMVYQTAALVDEDGNVALPFDHASQYALVLDSKSHDLPFTDLAANAWYTDAVAYVYRHDLMAGYGENLFGPDDDLSRAQLCQIIYNMEGQPATSGSSVFTDVADGAWYADAVTWAASQGIVGGYGNGLFGPEDNITREQLAAILYRYAQAKGYDTSVGENTNILSYTDALEISEYAIPAMQWACGARVINGTGDGSTLTPQGQATRAQAAVMLMRFCENYVTW